MLPETVKFMYVRMSDPNHYQRRIHSSVTDEGKEWIRKNTPERVISLGRDMLSVELAVRHEMLTMRCGVAGEYLLDTESPDGLVLVFRGVLESQEVAA